MRQALKLTLLSVFLLLAVAAALIGYFAVEEITADLIERELTITHADITRKFKAFDVLLGREELQMEARMAAALPTIAKRLLSAPSKIGTRSMADLNALAVEAGVDNVYVIDRDTVIVETNFAPDRGFELGTISPDLRAFLKGVIGKGKFVADRINMSSKTGILSKYGYFSPIGSDYIAEVSIRVRDFLARERSPEFVDFLFGTFFKDLADTSDYFTDLDIHMVNSVGRFSLFDGSTALPAAVAQELRDHDRVTRENGNRLIVYTKLAPVDTRLSTAEFLAVTASFDFSSLATRVRIVILLLLGAMIVAAAVAYIVAARLMRRYIVDRVENVCAGVAAIASGDYSKELVVSGQDEINDIVDGINAMRRQIQEDIARRDSITQALARAKEAAEEANEAKTKFLATMSHELRTPLTSIKAALGLVRGKVAGEIPIEVGETLDIALRNSDHLAYLIEDVLDVSRIESGTLNFVMEPIEVKALVEQAVEASRAFGEKSGVAIIARDVVPNAWIEADKGRLMQVFANLLSNAVKFSPEGSSVVVSAFQEAGKVQFVVTDDGCGIPKDFRPGVFERFTQADMSDSRKVGGTGLGLNIAKAIVEAHHGGSIGFISEENKGATFFFALPELIRRSGPSAAR